jgi:hypothetical protein
MTQDNPTARDLVFSEWRKCLQHAREHGYVPAEAVQKLIVQTREMLVSAGASKQEADVVLFDLYTTIHWDGDQPTDRVFEAMLEFELAEFFKERGLPA